MIFVFVHQNFPGQYRHLVQYLANQPENTVYFITRPNENVIQGVIKLTYQPDLPNQLGCHPYVFDLDNATRYGVAVARLLQELRNRHIWPDLILGHSGWGETLFIKDVFPNVPLLTYFEFFYHAAGADVGFDAEFAPSRSEDQPRLRMRNLINHLSADRCDWGHTPTHWQRSLYPPELQSRISVLHEGIDTARIRPDPQAWLNLARQSLVLHRGDEIVTFVARNLEPYRGFHIFVRTLPELLRRRPKAHILIVGGDGTSYGRPAPAGTSYREMLMREIGHQVDFSRIHFLGPLSSIAYLNVLQVSAAHVYLTYPFVLSWSFLEAMAAGCLVVGSETPPVQEVLRCGENGFLVDFFSSRELCDRIDLALSQPEKTQQLRDAARRTVVGNYDLHTNILPRWLQLINSMVEKRHRQ